VIVAADHGHGLGDHGEQDHGYLAYNSTVHVPLILAHPGRMAGGFRATDPVSLTDVYPSVLEWLRLPLPERVRGSSFSAAFRGEPVGPRLCYVESEAGYRRHGWAPLHCLVTNDWKYIRSREFELYDLRSDPSELQNLATAASGQRQQFDSMLAGMASEMAPYSADSAMLSGIDRAVLQTLGPVESHAEQVRNLDFEALPGVPQRIPLIVELAAARGLVQRQDYQSALDPLRRIVEAAPEIAESLALLGRCCEELGQLVEAEQRYLAALQLQGAPRCVRYRLGRVLLALDRPEDAVVHLEQVVQREPETLDTLAAAYAELGRFDEAVRTAEQALELAGSEDGARKTAIQQRIQAYRDQRPSRE
jgi:tetratricopeptide (TPR) repeat protein